MAPRVPIGQFSQRLDLAASIGAVGIELTQAGNASGAEYLLSSATARDELLAMLTDRGLVISALNCSGMPLHPIRGKADQALIRTTILLAEAIGVRKIVAMSGVGGDGPGSTTINWAFLPWPDDMVALLDRQWKEAHAYWRETARFAADHGVERIALELHPLHLVYNVPTLERLRDAVGAIVGATVDPSHLFWQSMDPVAVVKALRGSVYHVQLKDTELIPQELAIAGVLDNRPFSDPTRRAWIQRTIGRAHDSSFWAAFLEALRDVGYDDYVSIEHEDPFQSYEDGVREAAELLRPLLAFSSVEGTHAS
jgi:sugar phosphate isomerase/epimerase